MSDLMPSNSLLTNHSLQELKLLKLRSKRKIDADLSGNYLSAFRGSGITFSDLREYTPGDDTRHIHWKASARSGKTYVKTFEEDRLLNIILVLDLSSSTNHGLDKTKHQKALEFCGLITQLAKLNHDSLGLCTFSADLETYLKPKSHASQFNQILSVLISAKELKPSSNLNLALKAIIDRQKRRSIIFILSDFYCKDYQEALNRLSFKHDVIGVLIQDRIDKDLPNLGLIEFKDAENQQSIVIDTSSKKTLNKLREIQKQRSLDLENTFAKANAELIQLEDSALSCLKSLMKKRNRGR